jgi:hypothetical protein
MDQRPPFFSTRQALRHILNQVIERPQEYQPVAGPVSGPRREAAIKFGVQSQRIGGTGDDLNETKKVLWF